MQYWKKLNKSEIRERVFSALESNIDFRERGIIGIPASHLDNQVFYNDAPFLNDAPYLTTMLHNPNHIGCHTEGESEEFFSGTQALERELINLVAMDILSAKADSIDGYVASGGTEANIEALWIYRNLYKNEFAADANEIAIICSEDTHYSIPKGANLLNLSLYYVEVDFWTRNISVESINKAIVKAQSEGKKYFIVIANMGTTMFGSIDDPDLYVEAITKLGLEFRMHADGAFGGFIYPISNPNSKLKFDNPHISSVTIDAHKMLQAPYGTGLFFVRKGLIHNVMTKEAEYVHGHDFTLIGSRSGANAVAVWMILQTYGYFGWLEEINKLLYRTAWVCRELDKLEIKYYRHPKMNIVTIAKESLNLDVAHKYGLVPDTHSGDAKWHKIVVMDHVTMDILDEFINELKN